MSKGVDIGKTTLQQPNQEEIHDTNGKESYRHPIDIGHILKLIWND
jgi:hypothetical protein